MNENNAKNGKKKEYRCSKYRRLIKEHEGPHGPRCNMDALLKDEGENEEERATKETGKEAEDEKQNEERLVRECHKANH